MSFSIPLSQIADNPWNTRQNFDPAYIEELATDIEQNTLLQPPVVRLVVDKDIRYELAFGHCRFRAYWWLCEKYGDPYSEMPTELRELTDEQMADFAWAENEKRRDVTPIERMRAIQKQMADFRWTQAEIAKRRGLSESTVSNILRLDELPEDAQARVHRGELSERQAIALLAYYGLPEGVRKEAAKKTYLSNPVQYAEQGKSSDEIRNAVTAVISSTSVVLPVVFLEGVFEGDGFLSPTCQGCANHFQHGQNHYCGEQTRKCYQLKQGFQKRQLLQEASQLTGLPILPEGTRCRALFNMPQGASLHPVDGHPGMIAQGCEHLHVRLDDTAIASESLTDPRFLKVVGIVCSSPDGECACAKAMAAARNQNKPIDPDAERRQQQQTEEQAKKAKLVADFTTHIIEPTRQASLEALRANDVRFWQTLLDFMSQMSWEEIARLDIEACQSEIVQRVFQVRNWAITNDTESELDRYNVRRAYLGLAPLDLPEDENATPADKLLHRLERIEGWLDRLSEDNEAPTVEAVQGNLDNLVKLHTEYEALSLEDQTLPNFLERLDDHYAALSQWLDEADAELNGESDEEPEDEEEGEAPNIYTCENCGNQLQSGLQRNDFLYKCETCEKVTKHIKTADEERRTWLAEICDECDHEWIEDPYDGEMLCSACGARWQPNNAEASTEPA